MRSGYNRNQNDSLLHSYEPVIRDNGYISSTARSNRLPTVKKTGYVTSSSMSRLGAKAVSLVGYIGRGPFDDWNRFEIVEALIEDGHILRDENYLSVGILRSFAEKVFEGRDDFPDKPQPYSDSMVQRRNTAAMVIQNAWLSSVTLKKERIRRRQISAGKHNRTFPLSVLPPPEESLGERESYNKINLQDSSTHDSEDCIDDTSGDEENRAATLSVLEQEWVPPSWEYARMYADCSHPRKGGVGGSEMSWLRTTTGRHCVTGHWGEQCDMFEEKQVSELSRYGPGITNYFKFLKWCFWIFTVLSCLNLPILILNTFGHSTEEGARLHDLSQTMAGNLGGTNVTKGVHFPGCNDNIRNQSCDIDKSTVALLYAYIDIFGTLLVIIGYLWLRLFEAKEVIVLDKNTVSAASYTVMVKGFVQNLKFTEAELKKHFAEVTGQAVSDVTIAYDNEREIYLYRKRGELMKDRVRCTQEYRYYRSLQNKGSHISQEVFLGILSKRVKATAAMREIDDETDRLAHCQDRPVCAFVTFERAIGSRVALNTYNKSFWGYLRMKQSLKFKNSRIRVKQAAEPSTIIWENLKYRRVSRMKRRLLTTSITVILLTVSAFTNIIARVLEQSATAAGGTHDCPETFWDQPDEQQRQDVEDNDNLLHCYCEQYTLLEQREDSLCKEYFEENIVADIFVYIAAMVVLATNSGIDMFLKASVKYEKHHSADAMEKSIFLRMFLLKLMNTGILFLFMDSLSRVNLFFGIMYEDSGNFTTAWYQTVGVSICLVQIGNIISPHLWKLYKYREAILKRKAAAMDPLKGALTQDDLNQLHLGPDFFVSHRYAQVMADLFVCYMFSTGMPILAVIAMLNFYVSYWVDKFLFLRYYRSPPRYKANIGRNATVIIPYAIAIHLCVSIWTLGNRHIFATQEQDTGEISFYAREYNLYNFSEKVNQRHTFPLFVLLVLVLFGIVLGQLTDQIISYLHMIARSCCGSVILRSEFYKEMERFLFNTINISYSRAVRRGIIKGLATYNILLNPRYKEAFGITDGFAISHKRVKSLRNFGRISFNDGKEIENHDRTSAVSSVATPGVLHLVSLPRGSGVNDHPKCEQSTRHHKTSSDTVDWDNRNSKKMSSSEQRTEIVLRTLAEEEEIDSGDIDSGNLSERPRRRRSAHIGVLPNQSRYKTVKYTPNEVTGVLLPSDRNGMNLEQTARYQGVIHTSGDFDVDVTERPVSAFVDIEESYAGVSDQDKMHVPDEMNPMNNGDSRRIKAVSLSNSHQVNTRRAHVMHLRPSPEDRVHIAQFRTGRSSRRAQRKTHS